MALTDWVQTAAAIYLAWQQNRIFSRQNEIIAAQSKRTAMQSNIPCTAQVRRYWPTLIMLIMIAATAYDIYDRHHQVFGYNPNFAWDDKKPLERVYQGKFTNETVLLDGKNFINPSFENVTLAYNGTGGFIVEQPTKFVNVQIATKNKVVGEAFRLHCIYVRSMGINMTCVNKGTDGRADIPSFPQ